MTVQSAQEYPPPEGNSILGCELMLMFTLGGFGGAVALATAETMTDSNSGGGAPAANAIKMGPAGTHMFGQPNWNA